MRFTCEAAGRAVSCCRHWSVQRAACCAVSQGTGLKTANTCVQGVDTASRKKHIHFVSVRALCSSLSHFSEKESYRILGESTQWALGVWGKGSMLQFFIVCISFAFRLHVFSFSLALLCHNLGRSNLSFIKMYMLAIWSKPKSETDLTILKLFCISFLFSVLWIHLHAADFYGSCSGFECLLWALGMHKGWCTHIIHCYCF